MIKLYGGIKVAEEKSFFPIMPESNWWSIRNQFGKTLPTNVSTTYLKTLLGLTTDQAARNLLSPLKALSIINEDGTPTERANQWRNDSTYAAACEAMLQETYPKELLDLFPEKDFDRTRAKEWFKATAKLGESAAGKAVALFAVLKSQEIKKEPLSPSSPQGKKVSPKTVAKQVSQKPIVQGVKQEQSLKSGQQGKSDNVERALQMHIDLQIHISPEASVEQIDAIFASMAKHLYSN